MAKTLNSTTMMAKAISKKKVGNSLLEGAGANTLQDRGAIQSTAWFSLNPYFNNN